MAKHFAIGTFTVALLTALTMAVESGVATPIDLWLNASLAPARSVATLKVFTILTSLGADGSLIGMALVATALMATDSRRSFLKPLWVAFLGAEASTYAIKYVVDRPRPDLLPGVGRAISPSFPSAHTAGTAALIGILAIIIAAGLPARRARIGTAILAIMVVGLIAFSRLFLNLHYASDVAAGFLVSSFWLLIGTSFVPDTRPRR